ncbi:MAG: arsenite oxidase small subunit, partial [Gammaproteobacteria bacterium]
ERRGGIIQCCSEQSVYDPAEGGRVLGGPAPQPLAAIALETDSEQNIYAVGVTGGMMFDQYFERFGKRLLIEYERMDIDSPVGDQSRVITMQDYTGRTMECG